MFFRFACAMTLLTCVSLLGISLEKQNLAMKRQISLQHYELQSLKEQRCRLVLETQRLSAPTRLLEQREQGSVALDFSNETRRNQSLPLSSGRLQQGEP